MFLEISCNVAGLATLLKLKKETLAQVFSCEFCEISENIFFREHLWATASEVVHFSFTFLLLTPIYFHLECKILVKSATWKRRRYWVENYKLINVSDLVKIKPKHANSKSFYDGKLKTRLSICNLCWHFLRVIFWEILASWLAESLSSDV